MSEVQLLQQQKQDVLHVNINGIGVWGYRYKYTRWSAGLHEIARAQGLDLSTLAYATVFEYLFRMTPALDSKISQLLSVISPNGQPYLAMHVRTGGDELPGMAKGNWTHFVDADSALQTMPKSANIAMNTSHLPATTKWLLATDDLSFGKKMQDCWPRNVVLSNKDLTNGLHINRRPAIEGAILTFADWILMIRAKILLQAGTSSFSGSAILYRDAPCTQLADKVCGANKNITLFVSMCYADG